MSKRSKFILKNDNDKEKQIKCLLVHVPKLQSFVPNNNWTSFINYISVGLFSLCQQLELNGFKTQIVQVGLEKFLDNNFLVSEYIKESGIKFVGLSLNWHFQAYDTIEVARAIKEKNPDTFVSLGGYTASCYADEILNEYPFIDAVIKGEGEASIAKMAKKVFDSDYDFKGIPNLCWRKNGEVYTNEEVFVASSKDLDGFSFYDELENLKNKSMYFKLQVNQDCEKKDGSNVSLTPFVDNEIHTIPLGRGCTGNCTWCGGGERALKKIMKRECVSWRSPIKIADEMLMLKRKYNINAFYFCFDPTPWDRTNIIELFNLLGKTGEIFLIYFECFGLPSEEFMLAVQKNLNKNSVLILSPEFANEKLRQKHKSFSYTNAELEKTLERMQELGIKGRLFFTHIPILGDNSIEKTKDYLEYLESKFKLILSHSQIIPIRDFEPGAPWTVNPSKYGIMSFENKSFKDFYKEHSDTEISWESKEFK